MIDKPRTSKDRDMSRIPAAAPTAVIRSTRRPKLKVVGCQARTDRHRVVVAFQNDRKFIVEIMTFAEMDATPEWERPDNSWFISGLGWLSITDFASPEELEDVENVRKQAFDAWLNRE